VAPVTIVNTVRTGAFVPVTSAAGVNLFIGNNQGSPGHAQSVFGEQNAMEAYTIFAQKAEQVVGKKLDPTQVSRFWTKQTWAEIADDPARFVLLLGKKLLYGLNDFPICDSWNIPYLETEAWPLFPPWPGFGVLLSLGLLGLIVLWRRGPRGTLAVHGVAAMSFITTMMFFVADRYRTPLTVALCIASGPAVAWCVDRIKKLHPSNEEQIRKRSALSLAGAALLIALAANIAFLPILKHDFAPELDRLARAYLAEGKREEAIKRLERLRRLQTEQGDIMSARRTHAAILRLSE